MDLRLMTHSIFKRASYEDRLAIYGEELTKWLEEAAKPAQQQTPPQRK